MDRATLTRLTLGMALTAACGCTRPALDLDRMQAGFPAPAGKHAATTPATGDPFHAEGFAGSAFGAPHRQPPPAEQTSAEEMVAAITPGRGHFLPPRPRTPEGSPGTIDWSAARGWRPTRPRAASAPAAESAAPTAN